MRLIRIVFLAAACFLQVASVRAAETLLPRSPDEVPAVIIGHHAVSQYLLAKYYGRFVQGTQQGQHRDPTPDEGAHWIGQFFAQQVVIAHAEALGYGARAEVRDTVDQMERYMLTQPSGPFYEALQPQPPLSDSNLRDLLARTSQVFDTRIVRFPDADAALAQLGGDFGGLKIEEQARRITQRVEQDATARQIDGRCVWPFRPFMEIAEVMRAAKPGEWVLHREPFLGLYCIFIRAVESQPAADFDSQKEGFQAFELRMRQEVFQRRRRAQLLQESGFMPDAVIIRELTEYCALISPGVVKIEPVITQSLAGKMLCRYRTGTGEIAVSAGEFARHFDRQFIRTAPRTASDLRELLEDLVVGELDYRAARALGIDRTPRFVQDRLGFAGFQILDLYEKDVLVPQLGVGDAEIERYYREHGAEFEHPSRIRARLVRFSSAVTATQWQQQQSVSGSNPGPVFPDSEQAVDLDATTPLRGLEPLRAVLLQSTDGAKIGPLPLDTGFVIFVKEKTLEKTRTPLPEATGRIREALTRAALDRRESEMAPALAAGYAIEDHLDYSRYGVTAGQVAAPWRK